MVDWSKTEKETTGRVSTTGILLVTSVLQEVGSDRQIRVSEY